jgi:hypothetical protein
LKNAPKEKYPKRKGHIMESFALEPGYAVKVSSGVISVFIRATDTPEGGPLQVEIFFDGAPAFDGRWEAGGAGIARIEGFPDWAGRTPLPMELLGSIEILGSGAVVEVGEDGDEGGIAVTITAYGSVHEICVSAAGDIVESGSARR